MGKFGFEVRVSHAEGATRRVDPLRCCNPRTTVAGPDIFRESIPECHCCTPSYDSCQTTRSGIRAIALRQVGEGGGQVQLGFPFQPLR